MKMMNGHNVKKAVIVFDLGPGDGGKGGVVHKLSQHTNTHTIIKVGGAQGSHGVSAGNYTHNFSQWGCGTFEDVRTHITPLMVISPIGLLNECDGLRYCGITNAFDLLTIDELAVCATPYHGIASRIKEMARSSKPRGTIGTGVGEAFRDSLLYPDEIIVAGDLTSNLKHKLSKIRARQYDQLNTLIKNSSFLDCDIPEIANEMSLLEDDGFLEYNVDKFVEVGRMANIVSANHIKHILSTDGTVIVESSHGILTDNVYGFRPHVSALRTLPSFAKNMLIDNGFDGEIESVGVHRAYTIRHGAGPMPTADYSMNDTLLPGSHKHNNRYQGTVKVGPLDMVLLRYAIDVCGVDIDSLAITWLDQIARNGFKICDKYAEYDSNFFENAGRIKIFSGEQSNLANYQHDLCSSLFACKPVIDTIALPLTEQYDFCCDELSKRLSIPIGLISIGADEQNKLIRK